ncbi:MAG: hypothetical protein FIB06_01630 [Betaproteobacteria bacterium]|nr:hypothetical protein [Betaproteobacteria bacterium]
MNKANPPAWLPNWRNKDEYTDHGDNLEAWAWEFIRRHPFYQADFARWAALPDHDDGGKSAKFSNTVGRFTPMAYCHVYPDYPSVDGETVGEYVDRTGQWPVTLMHYVESMWGISHVVDPATTYSDSMFMFCDREMPPYSTHEIPAEIPVRGFEDLDGRLFLASWPREIDRYVVNIAFDIRYPIEDQIAVAREIIKDRWLVVDEENADPEKPWITDYERKLGCKVRRAGIPHKESRLTLLRILDADLSGATPDEVMDELYEGKAVRTSNRTEAADETKRYRDAFDKWHREKLDDAISLMRQRFDTLLKWDKLPASKPPHGGKKPR